MSNKAIVCEAPGGPEQLKWREVPMPVPDEGEILIRQKAVGLNFIDVYHRTGLYKLPAYPAILGQEGSGIVEGVGQGVSQFNVGDRIAYCSGPVGAYAQYRSIPARNVAKLPDSLSFELAAAAMLKGLTAHYLTRRTFMVAQGHTVLVHAAAGGVGLLLCQFAKYLGARVIGAAGSEEKVALALKHGCDEVILYQAQNVPERVRELTQGKGVNCVYDSVGKDTFMASLDCLMPMGILVSYGQSSGKVLPFDIGLLAQKGSLFLTRPSLQHYILDPTLFALSCAELFELVGRGLLKINIGQSYYLSDAASAHRDLEARKTTGSSILLVD